MSDHGTEAYRARASSLIARADSPNDLEQSFNGELRKSIDIPGNTAATNDHTDLLGCLDYVRDPLLVGPTHSSIASARIT